MINSVKNWFWHSETIAWARLQILFAVVWVVVSVADLSPLLEGKWLTLWLIFSGIVTELLRRRSAIKETVIVPEVAQDGSVNMIAVSSLTSPPPGP